MTPAEEARQLLAALGVEIGGNLESCSPIDGGAIGSVVEATAKDVQTACDHAHQAFLQWRAVPAPRRRPTAMSS